MNKIRLIGADWCPDCRRSKTFLGQHRIAYDYINMELFPEAQAEVERINGGKRVIPTIIFPDGSFLVEPSNDELADKLQITRAAMSEGYDVIIAGGGPAALTTAIYTARENLKTLIIEKSSLGGQAGITERLDNYPGFPEGISGAELAERFSLQAKRYGVEMLQAVAVESFESSAEGVLVRTSTGQSLDARALVIATGSTYRRTDAPGEAELIGAGIHFCATCDGPFYKGAKEITVIGTGNSGLEEGLFLTQFAEHVTVIANGTELTGSRLLQEKVLAHPKMTVRYSVDVLSFNPNPEGKLHSLTLKDKVSEVVSEYETAGAFVFIGLDPNTGWLPADFAKDNRGFAVTDSSFMSSIHRVFAAGDVRGGSTKQLASAAGEGAAVAIQIRHFLDAN